MAVHFILRTRTSARKSMLYPAYLPHNYTLSEDTIKYFEHSTGLLQYLSKLFRI